MTTLHQPRAATAADESPFFVEAARGDLLAVLTRPTGPSAGIAAVLLRGSGWRPSSGPRRTQVRLARALAGLGVHAVRFSYHGIAESGGVSDSVFRLDRPYVDDLEAVAGWVRAQQLRTVLVGNCFGARTALSYASRTDVAGLVLIVPPVHDFEVARRRNRRPLSELARRATPARVWAVLRSRSRRKALGRTARALGDIAGHRLRGDRATPDWMSRRFCRELRASSPPVSLCSSSTEPTTPTTATSNWRSPAHSPASCSGRTRRLRSRSFPAHPRPDHRRHAVGGLGRGRAMGCGARGARSTPGAGMTRLRVVHVVDSLAESGGAEQRLVEEVLAMAERFEQCVVHLFERDGLRDRLDGAGIPVIGLGLDRHRAGWTWPWAAVRLNAVLRRRRPDVVHTSLFTANLVGQMAARPHHIPVVSSFNRTGEIDLQHRLQPGVASWKGRTMQSIAGTRHAPATSTSAPCRPTPATPTARCTACRPSG